MERYVVEHEFDDEPTYVVDLEGEQVVAEFPPHLPATTRLKLAQQMAATLNEPVSA